MITAHNGKREDFNGLTDEEFENLLYQISLIDEFKNKFKNDKSSLMPGVGEKGQDCKLLKENKSIGVIQCKRYKKNIEPSILIREIIKFLLFYKLNNKLIPDFNNFIYLFAVSNGLTNSSIDLLDNFNEEVFLNQDLEKHIIYVLKKYKQFKGIDFLDVKEEIYSYLKIIKIDRLIPQDIQIFYNALSSNSQKVFFEIKSVIEYDFDKKKLNLENHIKNGGEQYKKYLINNKDHQYCYYICRIYKQYLLKYKSLVEDVKTDLSKNGINSEFIKSENEIISLELRKLNIIEQYANYVSLKLVNIKFNTSYEYDMNTGKLIDTNNRKIVNNDDHNGIFNYYKESILDSIILKWNQETKFSIINPLSKYKNEVMLHIMKNYIPIIINGSNEVIEKFIIEDRFLEWINQFINSEELKNMFSFEYTSCYSKNMKGLLK